MRNDEVKKTEKNGLEVTGRGLFAEAWSVEGNFGFWALKSTGDVFLRLLLLVTVLHSMVLALNGLLSWDVLLHPIACSPPFAGTFHLKPSQIHTHRQLRQLRQLSQLSQLSQLTVTVQHL